ncbi:MAG: type II secretion system F family protein [Alphaproteobacteria bacterium]
MDAILNQQIAGVPMPAVLMGFGGMLLVVLLGLAYSAGSNARTQRNKQAGAILRRLNGGTSIKRRKATAEPMVRMRSNNSGVDKAFTRFVPRPELLRRRLERAGLKTSIGQYALIGFVLVGVFGLLIRMFIGLPTAPSILFGFFCALLVPHLVVGFLIGRRKNKFLKLFPEGIDLIVRGLKSGMPVSESMVNVGTEIQDPVGIEFRRVTDLVRIGKSMDEALWMTAARINLPEFKFFVISLSIQRETGGNLAETLGNLSEILRKRQQAKLKIKALSSEAKASAIIIGALPFIMFFLLNMVKAGYTDPLLTDPRGQVMLAGALIWLSVGVATMAKMVRFEI